MRSSRNISHEDRLFDCYVAERAGEPLDPPYGRAPRRLRRLRAPLQRARRASWTVSATEADAETDAIFPAEWLRVAAASRSCAASNTSATPRA